MNKLKVYLSGSVKNADSDFQNWRDYCVSVERNELFNNLKFIDPIHCFNYTNKIPKTDKQCLDLFMWYIEQSDIILINLDGTDKSIGTAIEAEHAFCHNIPIIGFGEKPETWYNWIETRCSAIFEDVTETVDYISYYYGSGI